MYGMASFSAWLMRKTGKRRKKRANLECTEQPHRDTKKDHVEVSTVMAQANGIHREVTPVDTNIVPPGRVISTSMMRQGEYVSLTANTSHELQRLSNRRHHRIRHNGLQQLATPVQVNRAGLSKSYNRKSIVYTEKSISSNFDMRKQSEQQKHFILNFGTYRTVIVITSRPTKQYKGSFSVKRDKSPS